jgi:HEPN domain-containing protein
MKELKKWMEKAEKDLMRAKILFSSNDFEGCAFHSHQAAEKALKALYIFKFKRLWKIHDLKELSLKIKAEDKIVELCKKLNPPT